MTIFSELEHDVDIGCSWSRLNSLSHLVWVAAERLTSGWPLPTFSSDRPQYFASRYMTSPELFLLLFILVLHKTFGSAILSVQRTFGHWTLGSAELISSQYITDQNLKQYARWWLHHLSSFKVAFDLQHLPQFRFHNNKRLSCFKSAYLKIEEDNPLTWESDVMN